MTTPLLSFYRRWLPDWLALPALSLSYAMLLLLTLVLFYAPETFEMAYVDTGR